MSYSSRAECDSSQGVNYFAPRGAGKPCELVTNVFGFVSVLIG